MSPELSQCRVLYGPRFDRNHEPLPQNGTTFDCNLIPRVYCAGQSNAIWFEGQLMPMITKRDFVGRIVETTQCKHGVVKAVVRQFLDEIIEELANDNRLEFRDFGVFEVREQAARAAQNPKTLERTYVPARRRVKFRMGRIMREGMNGKGAEQ